MNHPGNERRLTPRALSPREVRMLGLPKDGNPVEFEDKIEDLRSKTPYMVITTAKDDFPYSQNMGKTQSFKKGQSYVMAAGLNSSFASVRRGKKQVLVPAKQQFKNAYRPYRGQDLDNKTLLVWRTGGIGDLLFIKPNLDHLKKLYPTCKIWFSCGPNYQSMVENWECIDELLDLPFNARYLYRANYHVTFEGVIERCKEAEYENAYRLFSRWMGIDLPDDMLVPSLSPKPDKLAEAKSILEDTFDLEEDKFILMQLRASSPIRCPELSMWVKLVTDMVKTGKEIVITDNPVTATAC